MTQSELMLDLLKLVSSLQANQSVVNESVVSAISGIADVLAELQASESLLEARVSMLEADNGH